MLSAISRLASIPIEKTDTSGALEEEDEVAIYTADVEEAGYQSTFARLNSVAKTRIDPLQDITDVNGYVLSELRKMAPQVLPH